MVLGLSSLTNLGNTCYINCIIQSLSNTTNFKKYIIDYTGDNEILILLKKIFIEMWKENQILSIKSFVNKIKKNLSKYNNDYHQDASEFLLDLFNYIHETSGIKNEIKSDSNNKNIILANNTWNNSLNSKKSIISSTFYGQFIKYIVCQGCDKIDYMFDMFLYIDVSANDISISKLIKNRFARDYIYKSCSECNQNSDTDTEHQVITHVYKLPEILIIYINRFSANKQDKNTNNIVINKKLDLSDFSMDNNIIYKLKSIICHTGDLNSGHYYNVINNSGKWYLFNDKQITLIEFNQLNRSDSYILFYER